MEYLEGVREGENKFGSISKKAREYLEGGNQVSSKSSPLLGMKAQPLQSLFVGEVTPVTDLVGNL